jgi:hypothetical protein
MKWSAYNSGTVNTTKKIAKMVAADDAKERKHDIDISQERVDETAKCGHEWVGLTDDEIWECFTLDHVDFARAIEAKLKEKNT